MNGRFTILMLIECFIVGFGMFFCCETSVFTSVYAANETCKFQVKRYL